MCCEAVDKDCTSSLFFSKGAMLLKGKCEKSLKISARRVNAPGVAVDLDSILPILHQHSNNQHISRRDKLDGSKANQCDERSPTKNVNEQFK